MSPIKKFVYRYILGVMMLHDWGEKAWPWNVKSIWSMTDFDERLFERYKRMS